MLAAFPLWRARCKPRPPQMLFDGWASVARIVLVAVCTYAAVVVALRIAGEQALAKMSAFDLVITIALGSIVATVPLSATASLADGVALITVYLLLQAFVRKTTKRSKRWRRTVKAHPRVVVWEGEFVREHMRLVDVTDEEVRAAIRNGGFGSLSDVQAVVLENDGDWSVIPRTKAEDLSAFVGLELPDWGARPDARRETPEGQRREN